MTDDTLRNQLLAAALQGLLAGQFSGYPYYTSQQARDNLAGVCVSIVDAVMAENAKQKFEGAL